MLTTPFCPMATAPISKTQKGINQKLLRINKIIVNISIIPPILVIPNKVLKDNNIMIPIKIPKGISISVGAMARVNKIKAATKSMIPNILINFNVNCIFYTFNIS